MNIEESLSEFGTDAFAFELMTSLIGLKPDPSGGYMFEMGQWLELVPSTYRVEVMEAVLEVFHVGYRGREASVERLRAFVEELHAKVLANLRYWGARSC